VREMIDPLRSCVSISLGRALTYTIPITNTNPVPSSRRSAAPGSGAETAVPENVGVPVSLAGWDERIPCW
jgi:hypothetical protein